MIRKIMQQKVLEMGRRRPVDDPISVKPLIRLNIMLGMVCDNRGERLALLSALVGRTLSSSKELTNNEILAFNELAYEGDLQGWVPEIRFIRELTALKEGLAHERT